MDRRSGRIQAHPVLWTTASVRKRRATDQSMFAYMRRYLGHMIVVLTLITPLLVVMTYQWAPRRAQREADELVTIALAAAQPPEAVVPAAVRAPGPLSTARASASLDLNREAHRAHGVLPAGVLITPDGGRPIIWYRVAGEEQGVSPYLLEALHQIESSAAPDGCWPNADGSGAVGPFQFKRATFAQYGVDGNGDGAIDICGFADSLVSAARYLRALGATGDLDGPGVRRALERYGTDVDRVIDLARYYRSRDSSLTADAPSG